MSIKILVDPTEEEIIKNIKTRKPFKILGMMDKWKATKKWDLDFFVNNFGNKKIRVKNINENKEMEMTISNYINYINEPYDSNKLLLQNLDVDNSKNILQIDNLNEWR